MSTMEIRGAVGPHSPAEAELSALRPLSEEEAGVFVSDRLAEAVPLYNDPAQDLMKKVALAGWQGDILQNKFVVLEDTDNPRQRYTVEIAVEGQPLLARITEPEQAMKSEVEEIPTFVHLPGFSEMIDGGTAKNLHDHLAFLLPDARIVSIATDGVSRYGQTLGWKEGWQKNFDDMAIDRLAFIKLIAEEDPVVLVGVSMGTPLIKKMLGVNVVLQQERPEQAVSIAQVINHSHACVPGVKILLDMVLRFPSHIAREAWQYRNDESARSVGFLAVAKSFGRSLPAMLGNMKNLVRGVSTSESLRLAEAYPTGFISGDGDPLAQLKMLRMLSLALPETVSVYIKPGVGHAASLDAAEAAIDITDMSNILAMKSSNKV